MRIPRAVGLVVLFSLLTSTREGLAEASRNLARWNPLLWTIAIGLWAFILWPR